MEITKEQIEEFRNSIEKRHKRGKILGGVLVVTIGSLFLARELGAEIPTWIFSWKMLVIGIGIVGLLKHSFMNFKWWLVVAIGTAFLFNDLNPEMHIQPLVWPILAIVIGLVIIFKPRNKFAHRRWEKQWAKHNWKHHGYYKEHFEKEFRTEENYDNDTINSVNIFGGTKKNIISKKFKGGEIVNVFGGSHINLMQADFEGEAKLELVNVFGGTELIIPNNWNIRSEIVTVLGGLEDKRPIQHTVTISTEKTLVLIGTAVFGGIEIKSY